MGQRTKSSTGQIITPDALRRREGYRVYRDPLPAARPGRAVKYPFAQMKVGDCFYVPVEDLRTKNVVAVAARSWAKRNSKDWKFVTRVIGDRIGIWRVA